MKKIAITDLKPTLFTDENGKTPGFYVNIIEDISEQEDWNIIWVRGSLSESYTVCLMVRLIFCRE